jgi:hypothetical protein
MTTPTEGERLWAEIVQRTGPTHADVHAALLQSEAMRHEWLVQRHKHARDDEHPEVRNAFKNYLKAWRKHRRLERDLAKRGA